MRVVSDDDASRTGATPLLGRPGARLALVLLLGAALQALLLVHDGRANPFARAPLNDARVYWDWAGDLARGEWIGGAPYFSAPLYPHVAGLVRAVGGELTALYVVQALLHLATAALVFRVARERAGLGAATFAALLWVLVDDAGYGTGRVLNGAVQCFTVALLLERALAFQKSPGSARALAFGGAFGLATLANPVLLALAPFAAAWCAWSSPPGARARVALLTLATTLACVAPATVHNALACGEFVPVSAQAGVTFFHGNAPGADGTYHAIEGVSSDRIKQNVDARELVRGETDGSWNATSSAWLHRGLAWWRAEPGSALVLALRKLWWFLTGRAYGDIYLPELEAEEGWSRARDFAPLPAAWLVLPALFAACCLARAPRHHAPELALLLVPLATVVVFWYSPRYRLPALPVACVLVAGALLGAVPRARRLAAAIAVIVAMLTGPLNRALGFDALDGLRPAFQFHAGKAWLESGRLEEAAQRFRKATELGHPEANSALGDVLRRMGRPSDALELLRDGVLRQPNSVYARRTLAVGLAETRAFAEARREFEAALALDPRDWESLSGLGGVLYELGELARAAEALRRAIELRPDFDAAHYNLGVVLEAARDLDGAMLAYDAAVHANPKLARATHKLAILKVAHADFRGALQDLAYGRKHAPDDRDLATTSAWLLATAPDAADRDGRQALALVEPWCRTEPADPGLWNIRAAALAECGRFGEAVEDGVKALQLAGPGAPEEARTELAKRIELYRQGRPFHQPRH